MQCRCFRWRRCWSAVDGHRQTPQAVCQSQLAHPRSGRAAESSLVAGYNDPPVYSIGSLCCLLILLVIIKILQANLSVSGTSHPFSYFLFITHLFWPCLSPYPSSPGGLTRCFQLVSGECCKIRQIVPGAFWAKNHTAYDSWSKFSRNYVIELMQFESFWQFCTQRQSQYMFLHQLWPISYVVTDNLWYRRTDFWQWIWHLCC